MDLTPDLAAEAVERFACGVCGAPAGRACRTRNGTTATRYHTPRFILVPALQTAPEVLVPADRGPGRAWRAEDPVSPASRTLVRIGYACGSVASDLPSQVSALQARQCQRVFTEVVRVGVRARPELERALALAAGMKQAAPSQAVALSVPEVRRLARNAAELISLAAALRAQELQLEVLAGPLAGLHDPNGVGSTLFAVLTVAAELDRDHRREKTLAGQQTAATRGRPSGRPKVFDDSLLATAHALRDQGVPVPEIAGQLTIKTGKNAGQHPSIASVYRALAETVAEPLPAGTAWDPR